MYRAWGQPGKKGLHIRDVADSLVYALKIDLLPFILLTEKSCILL